MQSFSAGRCGTISTDVSHPASASASAAASSASVTWSAAGRYPASFADVPISQSVASADPAST